MLRPMAKKNVNKIFLFGIYLRALLHQTNKTNQNEQTPEPNH
jgi:hypothetical protein